ncbi:UDP-2,3-diacylglucosamine diphosphatase LpxI [Bradyrhizobium sp. G127]|uniref:LpxI family protein n=1 Tax=Bradyrhizobium sp. G127 TaxID=2904800 RepID=UPI001F3EAB37|nr:UDP-2,3-diacylglucosamine diphosphatase LpxI [Bradyrhizobium sp. G127]MCF2523783.1 UDP-2,3-diacylglucosamine diphosphatase LpxI [Bradyrhizobium sp. G127]
MTLSPAISSTVGIIAGSGVLPFSVAESLRGRGIAPVLFAIRGFCDPVQVAKFSHHWVALGQVGRLTRLLRAEGCRDIVFIGGLVRPALSEIRLDWGTLRAIPAIAAALRGGDDHLLSGVSRIFERYGFRVVSISDVAPELLMPEGSITRLTPDVDALSDIAKGCDLMRAIGPFDIGQAVVVIDGHVVAVEDIEGTDGLLARVARLRQEKRIRARSGRGVLVKMPKTTQDLRFDLPTLGPKTVEGLVVAGLAGIAIVAGQSLVAEADVMIAKADQAGLFVTGLPQ